MVMVIEQTCPCVEIIVIREIFVLECFVTEMFIVNNFRSNRQPICTWYSHIFQSASFNFRSQLGLIQKYLNSENFGIAILIFGSVSCSGL